MDIFYPTGCFLVEQYKTAGSDRTLWMWWMRSHALDAVDAIALAIRQGIFGFQNAPDAIALILANYPRILPPLLLLALIFPALKDAPATPLY